ncbi:MAG: cell division protein SepF [Erysipelotrichaceae bacterium]|nr:cell division protein SepF [Erysipelotrichaceae bacterium]
MSVLDTIKKWLLDPETDEPEKPEDKEEISFQKEQNLENVDAVILLARPQSFRDAQVLSGHIKKGRAVMVNLDDMVPEEKQRLVDFVSGVVMAQDGMIAKIHNNAYVCGPKNIGIIYIKQ